MLVVVDYVANHPSNPSNPQNLLADNIKQWLRMGASYPIQPPVEVILALMAMFAVPTANHDRPPAGDYQYRRREEAWALDERVYWRRKPTIGRNVHVVDFYKVVAIYII